MTLPFWFFEMFVAIVQAMVFAGLTISYLAQAKEEH
jgi:F0F1-type ATP synthase membrane subunit a